jgi:hypothetical protein
MRSACQGWEKRRLKTTGPGRKPITIKYLGTLPRNGWKFRHTVAFLLDSQAKIS